MIRPLLTSVALLTTLLIGATSTVSAHATPSSDAVGAINELRTRMGVRALENNEVLAADCQLHATWMRVNGLIAHAQSLGSANYSDLGNDAAARSVLHKANTFVPQTSAATVHWRTGAPLHLYQLLHPALVRSGYAFDDRYACMWALDPRVRTGIAVRDTSLGRGELYTWPPNGAGDVSHREDTSGEYPNPNEQLGLPRSQVTGPYVLVYAAGFGGVSKTCNAIRIVSVRLVGSDGKAVAVRWWDDARTIATNKLGAGQCPVPSGGGYFVAERPLTPGMRYTATIRVVGADAPAGTKPVTRTLTMLTGGPDGRPDGAKERGRPSVRVASVRATRRGRTYAWRLVATVRDASPTSCSATVQRKRVPCTVRAGRLVLNGRRRGAPRRVAIAVVVRDAWGNQRRLRFVRMAR